MKPIIFWGATGQAKVLAEFVQQQGYELVAVFDNNTQTTSPFPNVPIYYKEAGFLSWLETKRRLETYCLVAIGGTHGAARLKIQHWLEAAGCPAATVIHPTAWLAPNVVVGKGSQILAKTALAVEVRLGEACIVNTSASIDHESVLGNGVHIAPGATLAGCVTVGDYTMIGTGAVILPRLKIGSNVVVGAGAVVTKDIPNGKIVYGNPARIMRDNN